MRHRKTCQVAAYLLKTVICLLLVLMGGCSGSEQQTSSEPVETSSKPPVTAVTTPILGTEPTYKMSKVGILEGKPAYANASAINRSIWVPNLDKGYDPQGLTYLNGTVFVSAYQTEDTKSAECRVFALSATDGTQTGYFDLPHVVAQTDICNHAGGLTMMGKENGKDIIVLADTYALFKIDLSKALASNKAEGDALLAVVHLSKTADKNGLIMKGSFIDFDSTNLWIGTSDADNAENALAYQLDANLFTSYNGQTVSRETPNLVKSQIPIPLIANGMTFDADKNLWITSSRSTVGILYKLDRTKGCKASSETKCIIPGTTTSPPHYNVPIGTEDMSFDEEGQLWTVSEAGCKNYPHWDYSYPLVYRIDTSKLVKP